MLLTTVQEQFCKSCGITALDDLFQVLHETVGNLFSVLLVVLSEVKYVAIGICWEWEVVLESVHVIIGNRLLEGIISVSTRSIFDPEEFLRSRRLDDRGRSHLGGMP